MLGWAWLSYIKFSSDSFFVFFFVSMANDYIFHDGLPSPNGCWRRTVKMMPLHLFRIYVKFRNLGLGGYNFSIISLGPGQNGWILQTFAVSNVFCIESFVIHVIEACSLGYCWWFRIGLQAMAWCGVGDKPLPESIMSYDQVLWSHMASPGSAFIKPDQLDPWIKGQIKITLLPTISHLQFPNFASCGRACPSQMTQNLVTVGGKLWTAERFLFDPWSMDYADPVW